MSFGLLLAGFLATTNAGRVALARGQERPGARSVAIALAAGAVLIVVGAVVADRFLDALAISPESFRIAAGLVLAAAGLRTIACPRSSGPFAAVLVTPELACLAVSAGADGSLARTLGAAAIALAAAAAASAIRPPEAVGRGAPFLAALQVVVAVALMVSGVRDV